MHGSTNRRLSLLLSKQNNWLIRLEPVDCYMSCYLPQYSFQMPNTNCFQRWRHLTPYLYFVLQKLSAIYAQCLCLSSRRFEAYSYSNYKEEWKRRTMHELNSWWYPKLHTLLTFDTKMIALPLLPFPSFLVVALLTGCEELGNVSKMGRSPDTQEHPKLCIVEIQERLASVVFHLRQKQSFALLKYPNHQSPRRVA